MNLSIIRKIATSKKLQSMLNLNVKPTWGFIEKGQHLLAPKHLIGNVSLLFNKIEDSQIEIQLQKLKLSKISNEMETNIIKQKPIISYDDFSKLNLRVGVVLKAKKLPKAKRLLVLDVDIGDKVIIIVSGIAKDYNIESIIGQKVTVLCNLSPRNLRGVESQGMILMTKKADGSSVFVQPDLNHFSIPGLIIE